MISLIMLRSPLLHIYIYYIYNIYIYYLCIYIYNVNAVFDVKRTPVISGSSDTSQGLGALPRCVRPGDVAGALGRATAFFGSRDGEEIAGKNHGKPW